MTVTNQQTPPKQGVRARERNALERISGLESDFGRLVGGIQGAINDLNQKITTLSEVLDSVVDLYGPETIQKHMGELREKRAQEKAKASKDALDLALIDGRVVQLEKVEEGCIITGVEKDKDGNAIPPGYVQLPLASIKAEFKDKMIGQGVGYTFETEPGGTFEVTGVYKAVPPPAPEEAPAEAPAAPAVEAPAEA
jgi:hypothetical protein